MGSWSNDPTIRSHPQLPKTLDPQILTIAPAVFDFCYAREIDEFYGVSGIYGEEGLDDLDLNDDQGDEDDLDPHLIAVGRLTGRFIDRDWLAERRTLCRVPARVRTS